MPSPFAEDFANQQWNQLVSVILGEMNQGGTNPNGRLQQVRYCYDTIDFWNGVFPAIGVQLKKVDEQPVATHKHDLYSRFWIRIAAQSTPTTAAARVPPPAGAPGVANLSDAMAQARIIMSDGTGNGLAAVLRDRAQFNLNGQSYQLDITGWDYDWEIDVGNNQSVIAYVTYYVTARSRVTF